MTSLTHLPDFAAMVPHIQADRCNDSRPYRWRFWMLKTMPPYFRDVVLSCPKCGEPHKPFRVGQGVDTYNSRGYVALTCPWHVNNGCSRSKQAREEAARLAFALGQESY